MEERLTRIEQKLDTIIELLKPVSAHAPFVDDLKKACQNNRILRSVIPLSSEPILSIENEPILLECSDN